MVSNKVYNIPTDFCSDGCEVDGDDGGRMRNEIANCYFLYLSDLHDGVWKEQYYLVSMLI